MAIFNFQAVHTWPEKGLNWCRTTLISSNQLDQNILFKFEQCFCQRSSYCDKPSPEIKLKSSALLLVDTLKKKILLPSRKFPRFLNDTIALLPGAWLGGGRDANFRLLNRQEHDRGKNTHDVYWRKWGFVHNACFTLFVCVFEREGFSLTNIFCNKSKNTKSKKRTSHQGCAGAKLMVN